MNNLKLILITFAFLMLATNITTNAQGGPKIKFLLTNEQQQTAPPLYIGVDIAATDGGDEDVEFNFDGTTLQEDYDLPPPPPKNVLYARIIRDSMQQFDTYSYVDFRAISDENKFHHRYKMYITPSSYLTGNSKITIEGNKLPNGIDSAKIRVYEGIDEEQFIDMLTNTSIILENQGCQNVIIDVGYNKNHTDITEEPHKQLKFYPNPVKDYINIKLNKNNDANIFNNKYIIYSLAGEIINSGNLENNIINTETLPPNSYFIKVGNITQPFIKIKD